MDAHGAVTLEPAPPSTPPITIADYLPHAVLRCPPKSADTYAIGFRRLGERFGERVLDGVRPWELEQHRDDIHRVVGSRQVARATSRARPLRSYQPDSHGHGAAENYVRAVRFVFRLAVREGLLACSPASELAAPPRPDPPERPLSQHELAQIRRIAATTGRDPELDVLLLDFLRHTAARRSGALNLCLGALDLPGRAVTVTEKRGRSRRLPLNAVLLRALQRHATNRGARLPADHVFRYRHGAPLTRRHFDALFDRIDRHSGWSAPLDLGAHWLRHTTLSDIAAVAGVRVAQVQAGHRRGDAGVIERYTHPDFDALVLAY